MNSKERVLTTLDSRQADRVPVNYGANAGIDGRLKAHFALAADDSEGLRQALGVDFRGVGSPYRGAKLHADIPERGVKVDNWGIHRRCIEHETGSYWDRFISELRVFHIDKDKTEGMVDDERTDSDVVLGAHAGLGARVFLGGSPFALGAEFGWSGSWVHMKDWDSDPDQNNWAGVHGVYGSITGTFVFD